MEFDLRNFIFVTRVHLSLLPVLVFSVGSIADETSLVSSNETPSNVTMADNRIVEEVVVEGEKIDPFELTPLDFERIYSDRRAGTYYFNIGDYEKAYPHLLSAAKNGFKDAQAQVGFIIIHGLGGVQKSNIRGVGWLGVASQGETAPTYRNYFRKIWKEIPSEHIPMMTEVVGKYRDKFGSDELKVSCDYRSSTKSHISKLYCFFDREYEYLDVLDWNAIMSAIAISGTGFSASIAP